MNRVLELGGTGHDADAIVRAYAIETLDSSQSVISVELDSDAALAAMALEADEVFVCFNDFVPVYCAHYRYAASFPLSRFYFFSATDMDRIAELQQLLEGSALEAKTPKQVDESIGEDEAAVRVVAHLAQLQSDSTALSSLIQGRAAFGAVGTTAVLKSGSCLRCGGPTATWMLTTIVGGGSIAFELCEPHAGEAMESDSLIGYLCDCLGTASPIASVPLDPGMHVQLVAAKLEEMFKPVEISIDGPKIKLTRVSGFQLVFRLTSVQDYAYVLLDPQSRETDRFDDRDHHKELEARPDHHHHRLPGKGVRASYATGSPLNDAPGVLAVLERREMEYEARHRAS